MAKILYIRIDPILDRLASTPKLLLFNCKILSVCGLALILTGCPSSPGPQVQDLIKIKAPTFTGASTRSFTSPSQTFTLNGECDKLSHQLEYAVDGGSWKVLQPNCLSGVFSIPMTLISGKTVVLVRSKGKINYSDIAQANIRLALPTTANFGSMVQSSSSGNSDLNGRGTQNTMGLNFDGRDTPSAANHMEIYLPGVVYAQ